MRVALVALLCLAGPTSAQDPECGDDLSTLPQQSINFCLNQRFLFWDDVLNQAYQQVIAIRDDAAEERLREAQRAWITYRDLTCEMEADAMRGGSGEHMLRSGCLVRLTERRARDLENYLQN
jgi:uncharacterized protein YecT (DUF1311 family)